MTPIGTELDGLVLAEIQKAYLAGKIRKTKDCLNDMAKAELFESDVGKVIMDAVTIDKAMPATSAITPAPLLSLAKVRAAGGSGSMARR